MNAGASLHRERGKVNIQAGEENGDWMLGV